jgi:ABC-2 type transport system permease protein
MGKIGLIARREFFENIVKPSFLYSAFGTPLLIFIIWGVIFAVESSGGSGSADFNNVIGYVDASAILEDGTYSRPIDIEDAEEGNYTLQPYATQDNARTALDAGEIDAYYLIPEGYLVGDNAERVSYKDIPNWVNRAVNDALLSQLGTEAGLDDRFIGRLSDPVHDMDITILDSGRKYTSAFPIVTVLLPLALGIIFFMTAQGTSQLLMNSLFEEKQNRIIEILVTTIKPMELLLGKVLGLGMLGLLQFAVWVILILVLFTLAPMISFLSEFANVGIPYDLLLIGISYFVLSYFVLASLMSAVGVLVGSQQQSGVFTMLFMIPNYFIPIFSIAAFFEAPSGAYVRFLSIFPLTSPISMTMRAGMSAVPLWEILLGLVLLALLAVFTAWVSGRLFRWGLLLYGKKITPREIINVVLGRQEKQQV